MIEQIWIMDKYDKQFAALKIKINVNNTLTKKISGFNAIILRSTIK